LAARQPRCEGNLNGHSSGDERGRVDGGAHGSSIANRNTVVGHSIFGGVNADQVAQQGTRQLRGRTGSAHQFLHVAVVHPNAVKRFKAVHQHVKAFAENDRRRLRVMPHVKFGGGRGITRTDRAAHHHHAGDVGHNFRVKAQKQGDVGQRREADQCDRLGTGQQSAAQQLDGVLRHGRAVGGRQPQVGETVKAVDGRGMLRRFEQRPLRAGGNWDVGGSGRIQHPQRIDDHLREGSVATGAGDSSHVERGVSNGQQQGESIVDAGVHIENDGQRMRPRQ
jgi:hypothetical protein